MKSITYNRINGPRQSMESILKKMSADELQAAMNASFSYGISLTGAMKKIQRELITRRGVAQPSLF